MTVAMPTPAQITAAAATLAMLLTDVAANGHRLDTGSVMKFVFKPGEDPVTLDLQLIATAMLIAAAEAGAKPGEGETGRT